MAIVELKNVSKHFTVQSGILRTTAARIVAVDDVSLRIGQDEIVGLVGESGGGKTTIGKMIAGLYSPDSGHILIDDKPLEQWGRRSLAKKVNMIFQDPFSSLNPKLSVGTILGETIRMADGRRTRQQLTIETQKLLATVGLSENSMDNYPHQFSGGQRQRVAIARALSLKPELIIADEPVSSLDVSIQSQIIGLFLDLKKKFRLSYLFITHDLNVVADLCNRIIILEGGRIVEQGGTQDVLKNPRHPYTKKLLSALI